MPVPNDYNALVLRLNDLTELFIKLKLEVQLLLLEETRDGLDPNATGWANHLQQETMLLSAYAKSLSATTEDVLKTRPGEAYFSDDSPEIPDTLPE